MIHDGPIMDLKYDPQFCHLGSVGVSVAQVYQLGFADSEWVKNSHSQTNEPCYSGTMQ